MRTASQSRWRMCPDAPVCSPGDSSWSSCSHCAFDPHCRHSRQHNSIQVSLNFLIHEEQNHHLSTVLSLQSIPYNQGSQRVLLMVTLVYYWWLHDIAQHNAETAQSISWISQSLDSVWVMMAAEWEEVYSCCHPYCILHFYTFSTLKYPVTLSSTQLYPLHFRSACMCACVCIWVKDETQQQCPYLINT